MEDDWKQEFDELVAAVAESLHVVTGDSWQHEPGEGVFNYLIRGEQKITARKDGTHVRFTGWYPRLDNPHGGYEEFGLCYGESHAINCGIARTPMQIAKDVARRFLPQYEVYWQRGLAERAEYEADARFVAGLAERLSDAWGIEILPGRGGDPREASGKYGGNIGLRAMVKVQRYDGGRVALDVHDLTVEEAVQTGLLLNEMRAAAEGKLSARPTVAGPDVLSRVAGEVMEIVRDFDNPDNDCYDDDDIAEVITRALEPLVLVKTVSINDEGPCDVLDGIVDAAMVTLDGWLYDPKPEFDGYDRDSLLDSARELCRGLVLSGMEMAVALTDNIAIDEQIQEPEMVHIPAGEFLMGSDEKKDKGAYDDEQPQHRLFLPDYYIAKTSVTNGQYLAFVRDTKRSEPAHWKGGAPPAGKWDHPVTYVTWHDAMAYCQWLAESTDKPYRLPSEAEWAKAARGTEGRIYPWGNEWDKKRCNSSKDRASGTTPVGRYSPDGDSPYGCADMAGNVWEWTISLHEDYPYDSQDGREDLETSNDVPRVLRGGAFLNTLRAVRCASRLRLDPGYGYLFVGFRPVLAPGL